MGQAFITTIYFVLDKLFLRLCLQFEMLCAIWYHLYSLKSENTHGGVLPLVNLQALATSFTESNAPPWMFFTFFKLYKWYESRNASQCEMCK